MELPTFWERAFIGSLPVDKQTNVSLSLAKHVMMAEANKDTNFVFSPLCLHHSLGLIAVESRGPTQDQVLSYCKSGCLDKLVSLHQQTTCFPDQLPCLSFVNGLWADKTHKFKLPRRDFINRTYKPCIGNSLDFQNKPEEATNKINTWAEKKTKGLIKDLVPSGSIDSTTTRVMLANALHFKGAWSEKFDVKDGVFFLSDGNSVRVPFMISSCEKKQSYVGAFDDFKVLRLPFCGNKYGWRLSMYFFLPDEKDGLPALLEKFGSIPRFIEGHLPRVRVGVGEIRVPKFRIGSGFEASRVFKEHGELVLPFSTSDDLKTMVEPAVGVSAIFHKSVIEVDEQGGDESSSSSSADSSDSRPSDEVEGGLDFVADHPFLFAVVREEIGGVVLLVGQVVNPKDVPAAATA